VAPCRLRCALVVCPDRPRAGVGPDARPHAVLEQTEVGRCRLECQELLGRVQIGGSLEASHFAAGIDDPVDTHIEQQQHIDVAKQDVSGQLEVVVTFSPVGQLIELSAGPLAIGGRSASIACGSPLSSRHVSPQYCAPVHSRYARRGVTNC
jgi:hypothetical protein